MKTSIATAQDIESPYAWTRLFVSLVLMTIGGSGMYTVAVVLPRIQAEFAVARGDASLPYTLAMIGFGLGGVMMGRLADRFGVMVPVMHRRDFSRHGFHRRRRVRQLVAVQPRARRVDGISRLLGDVRAARGRHVAMVFAPARHRDRHLHER